MEPANKSFVNRWFSKKAGKGPKGKTVIEYLPDADEIERSPVPRFAQVTMHVLLLSFAAFAVWASVSQLDQVVTAQGRLVNPLPNVVVQPLETSIIQSVDVRPGQIVKKGETLATLDATFIQSDETQLRVRLSSLETQIQGLERELTGEGKEKVVVNADDQLQASLLSERKANYKAQQMKMSETAARLRSALVTNSNDQKRVASRLRSLKEIEAMQEKMVAQRFAAPLQLLEAQQRTKEVERELALVISREQEITRELGAFEAEKIAFEKGWRQKTLEDMLALSRDRDSVKEQLLKADRRSKLVTLVSPVDSVVLEIAKLSPGSIIKEAETFFTLVPLNVVLEAEVNIDSVDVGYIKLGHPVRIKLDAYPFQKHGTLDGTVRTISEDAFRRDAADKTGASAYYLGRVTLEKMSLKNMIEGSRLLPGMSLTAEIVVGQRSVISYLAWPLTKGLGEAIREP
jgi:HlyD family secretion protein